jgi:hypothetical protein
VARVKAAFSKIIDLEDVKVTVRELSVSEIRNIAFNIKDVANSDINIMGTITDNWQVMIEHVGQYISLSDDSVKLEDLYPSEVEKVVAAFRECNASFLAVLEKIKALTGVGMTLSS